MGTHNVILVAMGWDDGFSFPKFNFDLDELTSCDFWCKFVKEFIGTFLFTLGVSYFGGSPIAWGFSFLLFSRLFSGCDLLSPFTFQNTMTSGKLVSGFFTLLAQALATNLACCPDMRTFLGVSGDSLGVEGFQFKDLLSDAAIFEFVAVMIYFFLRTKSSKGNSDLPAWLIDAFLVASVFWMRKDAILTPARMWSGENDNFAMFFGTYLNNFAAVFFGVNLSNYAF